MLFCKIAGSVTVFDFFSPHQVLTLILCQLNAVAAM